MRGLLKTALAIAVGAALSFGAAPAFADGAPPPDRLDGWDTMSSDELGDNSGGTAVDLDVNYIGTTAQSASSDLDSRNDHNQVVNSGDNAQMWSGDIHGATVKNNRGFTSVFQNSGTLANFNHNTAVNIYLNSH